MNRPNMPTIVPFQVSLGNDDYKNLVATFKEVSTYIDGLEKYCDFLENENKCYGEVYSECEMYKKAFNLAIKEIVKHNDKYPITLGDQYKYYKNKFLKEANNE